jgi:phenylacetate-CoA ligase
VSIAPHVAIERALRIAREQWLDPEELQRRQWARLQRILDYAYHHSPFYARKFRAAGIEPVDIQQLSDLSHIPVVTREELRHPEALIPPPFRPETMRHTFSSGSTGESVKSYFDPEGWLVGKHLLKLRARWACGVRPLDRVALFTAGAFSNSALRQRVLRQRSFSVHEPPEGILPELLRFAPTVLYGFPSHFKELAEVWPSRLRPKIIFTSGEMLESAMRTRIESAFGAPVCDVYGSTELKEIAWECRERDGYHINSDWVLVEIEEPEGTVLVTSLYNRGMPLIRYRLGDTGSFVAGRCRCGRSLPLMAVGFARSVDIFALPAGGKVSPYTLINAVEVLDEIRQFQIVQESLDRVAVVVVPRGEFTRGAEERVRAALGPHLPGIAIEIRIVASIERERGGKYRMAMSRVEPLTP